MNDSLLDNEVPEVHPEGPRPAPSLLEGEAHLERRVRALESDRARLNWMVRLMGAGLVGTVVALVVVMSSLSRNTPTLETGSLVAESIVLRGADGVTRGHLGTNPDGRTQFSLSDREGRERIRLTVLADGSPGVTISDGDARSRAVLGYLPDGTTSLVLADAQGNGRAVFGLEPNGSAHALFTDRAGAIRSLVGVGADGRPSVSVFEQD
jgi:hypothetical protein